MFVSVFNNSCYIPEGNPPMQSDEDCLNHLRKLMQCSQVLQLSQPPKLDFEPSAAQLITFHLFGDCRQPNDIDLQQAGLIVRELSEKQVLQAQQLLNNCTDLQYQLNLQQLLLQATQSASVSIEASRDAADLLQAIRRRTGKGLEVPLIDILIQNKAAFTSDFAQMTQMRTACFIAPETAKLETSDAVAQSFKSALEAFEQKYENSLHHLIQKSLLQDTPTYVPRYEHEFLLALEIETFSQLIKQAFNVDTRYPLYFMQSYIAEVRAKLEALAGEKAGATIEACVVKILNTEALDFLQEIYTKLTGKSGKFDTIDDFLAGIVKVVGKFCGDSTVQPNSIGQFSIYDLLTRQAEENTRMDMVVPYGKKIYLSKQQNQLLIENVLKPFEPEGYFNISEEKTEVDNYQPIFTLYQTVTKLQNILDQLDYKEQGLLAQMEHYEADLMPRLTKLFYHGRKNTFSQLKKEIDNFNSNYLFQFTSPLKYLAQRYATQKDFQLTFVPKPYAVWKSAFCDLVQQEFQFNTYIPLIDFFLLFVQRFDIEKQTILETLAALEESLTLQFMSTLLFTIENEARDLKTQAEFDEAFAQVRQKLRFDVKEALEIFDYASALTRKTTFVVNEHFLNSFRQVVKAFGFSLNKEAAVVFVVNLNILYTQIKTDFQNSVALTKKLCLIDYLAFMSDVARADTTIISRNKDGWLDQLAKLLLYTDQVQSIQSQKLSKPEALNKIILAFVEQVGRENNQSLSFEQIFQIIDPTNALNAANFYRASQDLVVKQTSAAERSVKLFGSKLYTFYIANKRYYGKTLTNITALVKLYLEDPNQAQITAQAVANNAQLRTPSDLLDTTEHSHDATNEPEAISEQPVENPAGDTAWEQWQTNEQIQQQTGQLPAQEAMPQHVADPLEELQQQVAQKPAPEAPQMTEQEKWKAEQQRVEWDAPAWEANQQEWQ